MKSIPSAGVPLFVSLLAAWAALLALLRMAAGAGSEHVKQQQQPNARSLQAAATDAPPYTYYTQSFDYFSKVQFLDQALADEYLPFENYPLPAATMVDLKTQSHADSPQTAADLPDISAAREIWEVGGPPTFPSLDGDAYWQELQQVVEMQLARRNNNNGPPPFRLPQLWEGFTMEQVAQAVNNEFPGY